MENSQQKSIYAVTKNIIESIESMHANGSDRAILADLRHSAGRPLAKSPGIWGLLFRYMPVYYLSNNGKETSAEKAVCLSLQLYAIYKQGNQSENSRSDDAENLGASLRSLRTEEFQVTLDRRFNMILTSSDFEELSYRLRQLIRLIKSKNFVAIDFAKLAQDLYFYQKGQDNRIRLSWAQSYYSYKDNFEKEVGENK